MTDILLFPVQRRSVPAAAPVHRPYEGDRRTRIRSRDVGAARRFYAAAVQPLGLDILEARADGFTLGGEGRPVLEVEADCGFEGEFDAAPETRPAHLAIEAPDGRSVRAFYLAALAAGGRQLDYPAARSTGGGAYYAAKVMDPDGNCIECGWRC